MYICEEGHVFDEPVIIHDHHGDYEAIPETYEACPKCCGGFEEADICPQCNKVVPASDIQHGLCPDCYSTALKHSRIILRETLPVPFCEAIEEILNEAC